MKTHNQYAACFVDYARIPKAVFAAVAYSLAARLCVDSDSPTIICSDVIEEWEVLYQNGIVLQKPPKGMSV